MNIRPADFNDLNLLTDITRRCIGHLNKQGINQWDDIYPSRKDFHDDIVAQSLYSITNEDKLCGCICINQIEYPGYEKANWQGSDFFVIHKIIIDPQKEGQGLGKFAMLHAEMIARANQKDSIRLDCFKENERANRFYQKLGYVIKGETLFRKGMFNLYEKMI
jgi:ribosomal protein S18 acetylase RimI-like enzyme